MKKKGNIPPQDIKRTEEVIVTGAEIAQGAT